MRIFYASDTTPNSAFGFTSNIWRNNLFLPLVELGNEVVEFDYDLNETFRHLDTQHGKDRQFIASNRPKVTAELIRQIKNAHAEKPIDLFFSYFYDACVLPEAIDEIKSMGIKTVNWYCNGSYQLHLVSEISPHYDFCLVPEKFRLQDYQQMGAMPIYCQEAANPSIYKPYNLPKEFEVTFIGQAYGERPAYIKYLLDNGIDVRVWGFRWKHFTRSEYLRRLKHTPLKYVHYIIKKKLLNSSMAEEEFIIPDHRGGDPLNDAEMIKMFSKSKINLGFSTCGGTWEEKERIVQIRLRDFEVPMSGGFYIVEFIEEIEEFFRIGKEIVCYTGKDDLVDKIKYYLKHDTERERIRLAGYERCLKDHTWHKRFQMAFQEMGLG